MGGVESHVHEVAQRIARQGMEVTVLSTDPSDALPREEVRENVNIRRVRAWPKNRDYYLAPEVEHVIRHGAWDVIHVQSYHTLVAPLAMWAARQARLPYVVTFHGGGHSSRMRNALRGTQWALLRPLLARAARLIAVAEFEIEVWGKRLRLPADRFVLIPNGSDLPARSSPPLVRGHARPLIASVGRLEKYKGHHRLLNALPAILERRPDVQLWVAGAGPYESDLKRLARELHVADHVDIHAVPPLERAKMAAALAQTDLVVLLSEYETHPVAVLEAVALRRPVLVAATSGLQELADKGWVRSIPLNSSPQQIAAAVLEQLERPLIPPPITPPSWDECASQLIEVYHEVAQRVVSVAA
jgi:glycosyltransferase involved in cell wall biosynthesis